MVATATASYFLLTADYGPEPNALDPVSLHIYVFLIFGYFLWGFLGGIGGRNVSLRNLSEVSDMGFH